MRCAMSTDRYCCCRCPAAAAVCRRGGAADHRPRHRHRRHRPRAAVRHGGDRRRRADRSSHAEPARGQRIRPAHRRARQVPHSGTDGRAHPSARRGAAFGTWSEVGRSEPRRGARCAGELSLLRRDHDLRRRQPQGTDPAAARRRARRAHPLPAHLRHRQRDHLSGQSWRSHLDRHHRLREGQGAARRAHRRTAARHGQADDRGGRLGLAPDDHAADRRAGGEDRALLQPARHPHDRARLQRVPLARSDLRRPGHARASDHPGPGQRFVREADEREEDSVRQHADDRRELQPPCGASGIPRSAAVRGLAVERRAHEAQDADRRPSTARAAGRPG